MQCPQGLQGVSKGDLEVLMVSLKSPGRSNAPERVSNASRVVSNVPMVSFRVSPLNLQPCLSSKLPSKILPPSMIPVHCSSGGKQERHIHPTGALCTHPRFLFLCKDFFLHMRAETHGKGLSTRKQGHSPAAGGWGRALSALHPSSVPYRASPLQEPGIPTFP